MTSALFSPIALRELTLANRIVVSPMCQYSAIDGRATDWHLVHWGQLLMSGAGMFTIEATAVTPEGRISPGDLGIYDDACEAALRDTLRRARQPMPAVPVSLQLAHAGRKGSSRAPWDGGHQIPVEDGGYVLIGTRQPQPGLFDHMTWSTETVMAETRRRLARLSLAWREPALLWDVDRPEDVVRLRENGFTDLLMV